MGRTRKIKETLELVYARYYGQYGTCAMMLSLTERITHSIGYSHGYLLYIHMCSFLQQRSITMLWILGATVWRR
jgi:hypothetical protein